MKARENNTTKQLGKGALTSLKKLAYDTFKSDYINDESETAESESILLDYWFPTQKTAKYALLSIMNDNQPAFANL